MGHILVVVYTFLKYLLPFFVQMYMTALVRVPHVADTASIKGFLGLMEKVCCAMCTPL